MSTVDERIGQFEKMAADDPDNDMAHFSLGSALLQAGRADEAARSLLRCVFLNEHHSKAYQLAGEALISSGRDDEAISLLRKGYEFAARKGDRMPQGVMADLLRSLGQEPPDLDTAVGEVAAPVTSDEGFACKATGRPGTRLSEPPMRGGVGKWICQNISAETWKAWIGQGTKVINELRLDFSREEDQLVYDQHMCEFLGIDEKLYKDLSTTPIA